MALKYSFTFFDLFTFAFNGCRGKSQSNASKEKFGVFIGNSQSTVFFSWFVLGFLSIFS